MRLTKHPKLHHNCVFCNYWMGDAIIEFRSVAAGYLVETDVHAQCAKQRAVCPALGGAICRDFTPSPAATKLL